ncbi:MAG: citrate synthase [Deltaproteobacteria bacterium]|nr:citrate synthase [Deltaproteobacteria bacterium]
MSEKAQLVLNGKTVDLPVVVGSENEKAVDIRKLRAESGYITLDPGFMNTGSTTSSICYIDGDAGILRYRGIPLEELAAKSTFVEVSYLLIYGKLPTQPELDAFRALIKKHSMLHEDMKHFFDGYPSTAHPMAILSSMVCSLSAYYPDANEVGNSAINDVNIARLLSKVRTIAAYSYKKSIGQPFMHPKTSYNYVSNFLQMMFALPTEPYEVDEEVARMLDVLLMLHADHEQNCSTSTVRMVGSSHANVYASISAGICALWGPLHGGANQEVLEMLEAIERDGGDHKKFIALAKNKDSGFRLMGFGHRVYKNYDPRAKIIKEQCEKLLPRLGGNDKLLDIARRLEEDTLKDPYFADRKLFPNVDFYSGIIYRALGIPTNMFTVMFALGRMPGWLAHWREMLADPMTRIGRPRQVYTGPTLTHYVPIAERA